MFVGFGYLGQDASLSIVGFYNKSTTLGHAGLRVGMASTKFIFLLREAASLINVLNMIFMLRFGIKTRWSRYH